ncbi:hypothetical protein F503_06693 [Ophiostoma piceae UAMH 11346]|uniref:Uncharacterized protein n=1 Tax=Ophiostoma piceae (strain UAMH 11346) TaxID=1262450 RepID=S3CS74_OPHP1|nr:hypothetical protein F503_06693 [Ophiostoma piceae UAMH 11346]
MNTAFYDYAASAVWPCLLALEPMQQGGPVKTEERSSEAGCMKKLQAQQVRAPGRGAQQVFWGSRTVAGLPSRPVRSGISCLLHHLFPARAGCLPPAHNGSPRATQRQQVRIPAAEATPKATFYSRTLEF